MNPVEDRIRAATQAAGEAVREVRRPLRLPDSDATLGFGSGAVGAPDACIVDARARQARRARRLKAWMAPVTAAAAVLAIGVSLVIVRDIPNGHGAPLASHAAPADAIPPYYVALSYHEVNGRTDPPVLGPTDLVAGETFTGARLATVQPPRGTTFAGVTGAADDRTFVVDTAPLSTQHMNPNLVVTGPRTWYLLRLNPGATPAFTLTRLPIPVTPDGTLIYGIAVSPDGTKLAVAEATRRSAARDAQVTRIYSVRDGALLYTWSPLFSGFPTLLPAAGPDSNATLFWTNNGRELFWDWRVSAAEGGGIHVELIELPFPVPAGVGDTGGGEYIPDCSATAGLLVTADGNAVVCAETDVAPNQAALSSGPACSPSSPLWGDLGFLEYSTMTGQLLQKLHKFYTSCDAQIGLVGGLWVSASGDKVIGYVYGPSGNVLGRPYVFTPSGEQQLPWFPPGVPYGAVAW